MVKQYFRTALRRPAFWFVLAALSLYTLAGCCFPSLLMPYAKSPEDPLLFVNYNTYFSTGVLCGLILPLFALYMHQDSLFFQKEIVFVKFRDEGAFWMRRIGMILLNALCFAFLVYFLFLLRCLALGILADAWAFAFPLLLNFISQVSAFSFFCLLSVFLSEFLHSQAIGITLVFFLTASDFYFTSVHSFPGFLLQGLRLSLDTPSQTLLALGIAICKIALLSFVLIFTADKRDCLPKKVS